MVDGFSCIPDFPNLAGGGPPDPPYKANTSIKPSKSFFNNNSSQRQTSSPKGNDRSPESNVPRSNLISKKNERASMETAFSRYKSMGNFLDAQGQLTPKSVVWSGRN